MEWLIYFFIFIAICGIGYAIGSVIYLAKRI
jgi:hypothetical protein